MFFLCFYFITTIITLDVEKINGICHFRFEPAPAQVLLSEEITGSLRKLKVAFLISNFSKMVVVTSISIFKIFLCGFAFCCKQGCCTLARDRFKSLEKRGLVVPSKKSCRLVKLINHPLSSLALSQAFWLAHLLFEI